MEKKLIAANQYICGMLENRLPLSWAYRPDISEPQFRFKRLRLSGAHWYYAADLPPTWTFSDAWEFLMSRDPGPFIIRGANPYVTRQVATLGGYYAITGREAVLAGNYPSTQGSKLRYAINKGLRNGVIYEWADFGTAIERLDALWQASAHHRRPMLKYLFRTNVLDVERLFVYVPNGTSDWAAAVGLTRCGLNDWHIEFMIRHRDSREGTMVSLLDAIYKKLAREGAQSFSLGEVPFYGFTRGWQSRLISRVGKSLNQAYNHSNLYAFKQKFKPIWLPISLVSNEPINLMLLTDMFYASNVLRIVIAETFHWGKLS